MKDNRFNNAIHDLKNIRMTGDEKQAMLARIVATPVVSTSARQVRSPWTIYSFGSWVSHHTWVVASLVLVVIAGSGGVASAAEAALPGSSLYTVKVDIIEPIRDVLAVSAESQATWQAAKAERRIQEASTLALEGALDDTTQADIETRLDQHARDFDRALEKVREQGGEDRADEIRVAYRAGLGARAQVLEVIAENDSSMSKRSARSIENHEDKRVIVASIARSRAESSGNGSGSMDAAPMAATMSLMMSTESVPVSSDAAVPVAKMAVQPISSEDSSSTVRAQASVSPKDAAVYARRKASAHKLITDIAAHITETQSATDSLQGKLLDTTARNLDEARAYIREAEDYQRQGRDDEARTTILEAERAAKEAELLFREGVKSKKSGSWKGRKESLRTQQSESLTSSVGTSVRDDESRSSGKTQKEDHEQERSGRKGRDTRKED